MILFDYSYLRTFKIQEKVKDKIHDLGIRNNIWFQSAEMWKRMITAWNLTEVAQKNKANLIEID